MIEHPVMLSPSVEGIKNLIKSWFEVSEPYEGAFTIETRDGWDGGDNPNPRNIEEGRRIIKLLRATYPEYMVTADVADEWVIIEMKRRTAGI